MAARAEVLSRRDMCILGNAKLVLDPHLHGCRGPSEGAGVSGRMSKRAKQPFAQLVEVDIPGAPPAPQRAPVARDASVDPYIGRHIM